LTAWPWVIGVEKGAEKSSSTDLDSQKENVRILKTANEGRRQPAPGLQAAPRVASPRKPSRSAIAVPSSRYVGLPRLGRTVSRAAIYQILWVRGFRAHTISGRGFNYFKSLRRHFRATPFCGRPPAPRDGNANTIDSALSSGPVAEEQT
jgi:hypothetical protein